MRLPELWDDDKEAKKLRVDNLSKDWKNIKKVFYYQNLLYILKIIHTELINWYYDNQLTRYFGIKKT